MTIGQNPTRRQFVGTAAGAAGLLLLPDKLWAQAQQAQQSPAQPTPVQAAPRRERPPKLALGLVELRVRQLSGSLTRISRQSPAMYVTRPPVPRFAGKKLKPQRHIRVRNVSGMARV
jgi:hypothetical protein